MKLFNQLPIQVRNYTFNEEHIAKCGVGHYIHQGFSLTGVKIDLLNTMIISYSISYLAGYENDLLSSYDSYSQFNFESEGLESDISSLTKFFEEYDDHTDTFFKIYGFKTLHEIKVIIGNYRSSKDEALAAIDNLRENNLYEY